MFYLLEEKSIFCHCCCHQILPLNGKLLFCFFNCSLFSFVFLFVLIFTLTPFFFIFIRQQKRRIIVRLFFLLLAVTIIMLDKVKHISVYDLIQKTFVQAIRQLHFSFFCSIPTIEIVWKFDGTRSCLQLNIRCKGIIYMYTILDGAQGVLVVRSLDWTEVCIIASYITCLKYTSVFLLFVWSYVPLFNIIYICFVVVYHYCSIPVV